MIANLADAQIEIERLGEEIQNLREENERLQTLVNKRAKGLCCCQEVTPPIEADDFDRTFGSYLAKAGW